jgi:hypothetical protein
VCPVLHLLGAWDNPFLQQPHPSKPSACAARAPELPDMADKGTAKDHGRQLKGATAHQRRRLRQRLDTGAWRDFHENKIARLPCVDPGTEYARTLRYLQASDARWRAEKNRAQSYTLGTQGVGGSAGGRRPFGGVPPPPQPRLRESGGRGRPYVSALLTARATATHR